jgi:hypothetical protein
MKAGEGAGTTEPPRLTRSDVVLLRGADLAPTRRWRASFAAVRRVLLVAALAGAALLVALISRRAEGWWTAGALTLAAAIVWRRSRPARPLLAVPLGAPQLERLLLAEALLANEAAGAISLSQTASGLRAEPGAAVPAWPPGSLEAALLRARPIRVGQIVADWRAGEPNVMLAVTQSAIRRGILRESSATRGAALVPSSEAWAALASYRDPSLAEQCRADRPALWRNLLEAVNEGLLYEPSEVPNRSARPDPRVDAGVDRFGVPRSEAPGQALTTATIVGAMVVIGLIVLARLAGFDVDPMPDAYRWVLPLVFASAASAFVIAMARPTWPDEPLPPLGSVREEDALSVRRRRRTARPRTRPHLLLRLAGGAAMFILSFTLAVVITPAGVAVLALAFGSISWRSRAWYRVQQLLPSEREVELAVARRSRELSSSLPRAGSKLPAGDSGPAAASVRRGRVLLTPDTLPPPGAAAVALTDQRRRLAAAATYRHSAALLLFATGLATVSIVLAREGHLDPQLIALAVVVPVACIVGILRRLLRAFHLTRRVAWLVAPGPVGIVLRSLAAILPRDGAGKLAAAGRALRRGVAEEPGFWRHEEFSIQAPLGRLPALLLGVTTTLLLLLLTGGLLSGRPDLVAPAAAGLGLAVLYGLFLHRGVAPRLPARPAPQLVLLRVFGSPTFDDLLEFVRPWLACGPVVHLEGYDSVVRSAEVQEALALDHLDKVLVASSEDLVRRLATLSSFPDDTGLYRRQAFQCIGSVWRDAIRALLERSDAVLMDLSSFGPGDTGCAYELGLLLDQVPLSRVLLLVDDSTDRAFLDAVLDEAERRISPDSPNCDDPAAAWHLLQAGGVSSRQPAETHDAWLRRVDRRLHPLPLVQVFLDRVLHSRRDTTISYQGHPIA